VSENNRKKGFGKLEGVTGRRRNSLKKSSIICVAHQIRGRSSSIGCSKVRGKTKTYGTSAGTLKVKRLPWRLGSRREESKTTLNDVLCKDQKIRIVIMALGIGASESS
jgi:hypothetical protein